MTSLDKDLQLVIASINGSGTLTANRILHKALFREGYNVVGKNLFPSNIEGLPTYYFLRISKDSKSLKSKNELYVGLNPATYFRDLKTLVSHDTKFLLNTDLKLQVPQQNFYETFSFKQTIKNSKAPIKIKKRMSNMSYVGWIAHYLNINLDNLKTLVHQQFSNGEVAEENIQVMLQGWQSFNGSSDFQVPSADLDPSIKSDNSSKILIEGNQAAALGWVEGGCTVATWYPITPSTSLVESFSDYAKHLRPKSDSVAILQSEDEISAISSIVGAGWAGARAATATSGPGLSLMSEALGLSYFAEIPTVVCDVQRVGPSTGLPTRTSQGDLEFAFKISHGDGFHPVLLPSDPNECFEMSAAAFDIADKYQTPVFVLSDLDLGMNLWSDKRFNGIKKGFERSQILNEPDLEAINAKGQKFKRYEGDKHGIPRRTLPGTHHPDAAYLTRGSGHNKSAGYSEHPEDYVNLMERLKLKILNARQDLPMPDISLKSPDRKWGAIFYGSTQQIFPELDTLLNPILSAQLNTCCVKSLPLHKQVYQFIEQHEVTFVIEQNRDSQLKNIILQSEALNISEKIKAITHFDGWCIQADKIAEQICNYLKETL